MSVKETLMQRSGSICELCESPEKLEVYPVSPFSESADKNILVCHNCHDQITGAKAMDANHWRCLNKSMWSPVPAVQVMVWRLLSSMRDQGWPQDLLDMLYLDEEVLAWAKSEDQNRGEVVTEEMIIHKDSNGTTLQAGDTVVLIKDLDVKGGGFTAKRGTSVRGITLVDNNAEHIEGKVNGQHLVILTKFVKKS